MVFLNINKEDKKKIAKLNNFLQNKEVFILIYMEGCGPCNQVRPEWKKIQNILKEYKNRQDVAIVDIDKNYIHFVPKILSPTSFPTIQYINLKKIENFEDSSIKTKDRSIDSFIEWIESKKKIQKGGIMINNKNNQSEFENFLSNSTLSYLSKGSNGLIFLAKANESYKSSYLYTNPESYGNPVTQLIIKITFLNDNNYEYDEPLSIPNIGYINLDSVENFKNEVNIQTDIFLKTIKYLQPLCPTIVYASTENNIELFDRAAKRGGVQVTKIFKSIQRKRKNKIGIIAMEFAEGYQTLYSFINDKEFNDYKDMSLFLLSKLITETGYTQGDFHVGNIMINPNYSYFKGLKGAPLLLDFGFAFKIPPDLLSIMKENIKNNNYSDALKELCNIGRSDKLDMNEYLSYYGWACGNYNIVENKSLDETEQTVNNILINKKLEFLNKKREESINDLVNLFNAKHESNSDKYPLLPLSNLSKNNLFKGLIGGKQTKKRKKNKKILYNRTHKKQ